MLDNSIQSNKSKHIKKNIKLNDICNYLREHPELINHEMNPYTAEKLMMTLDNEKLYELEEQFIKYTHGIKLPKFISLIKEAIIHEPEDKYRVIHGLIKLFDEIDLNGDGFVEWSEFTQYIIDAVISEKDTKFFDARFEKEREFTETELLDKAYARKAKKYEISKIIDNSSHTNLIKKIQFCPSNNGLLVLEQTCPKLRMYNLDASIKYTLEPILEERAFIIDTCFSESLNFVASITTDKKIILWENNLGHREVSNIKTDQLQSGIWYLENHHLWITAGADFILRGWIFNVEDTNSRSEQILLEGHSKKITDVIEIITPRLMASSSLDGIIKLWDLDDKILVGELKENTSGRGIKGLAYSYDFGGNILSYGFEFYISVWSPEVSLTRAYIGKLEGHVGSIVDCKFILKTPYAVSCDDKGNIRIWDIRTLSTIQLLPTEQLGGIAIHCIAIIEKYDKFIIGGKRLTFFENPTASKNNANPADDVYPIYAEFNSFYKSLVILTKIDVRIFDIINGKLKKVFTKLTDEIGICDLSTITLGCNFRKLYIGDNSGNVKLYNMKNGDFLKNVKVDAQEQKLKEQFFIKDNISNNKKKDNNEVTSLIYLNEEKILVTSSWDSCIRFYDERNPDESQLIRVLYGGHRHSDINTLTYSTTLGILASGSANGIISIWDFETGKLEGILLGHSDTITCLKFADPYPLLLSSSSDGTLCVWVMKSGPKEYRLKCILRILNSMWENDEEKIIGITSFIIDIYESVGIPRDKDNISKEFPSENEYFNIIHNLNPNKKIIIDESKDKSQKILFSNSAKRISLLLPGPNTLRNTKSFSFKEKDKFLQNLALQKEIGTNSDLKNQQVNEDFKFYPVTLEEKPRNPFVKPDDNGVIYNTLDDFKILQQVYDDEISKKKKRCYIYAADRKGYMHIYTLTEILKKYKIVAAKTEHKIDISKLRRIDWLDSSNLLENFIEKDPKKMPYTVHSFNTILIKRWDAHFRSINSVIKLEDLSCIITCSIDRYVKIWSKDGEFKGNINLSRLGRRKWELPFDWVENKLMEIDKVFYILEMIEENQEPLSETAKEEIKKKFLLSTYITEKDFLELNQEMIKEEKQEDGIKYLSTQDLISSIKAKYVKKQVNNLINPEYKNSEYQSQTQSPNSQVITHYQNVNIKESDLNGLSLKVYKLLENYDCEHYKDSFNLSKTFKITSPKIFPLSEKSRPQKSATNLSNNSKAFDSPLSLFIAKTANKKSGMKIRYTQEGSQTDRTSVPSTRGIYSSNGGMHSFYQGIKEDISNGDKLFDTKHQRNESWGARFRKKFIYPLPNENNKKGLIFNGSLLNNKTKMNFRSLDFEDIKSRILEGTRCLKLASTHHSERFINNTHEIKLLDHDTSLKKINSFRNSRKQLSLGDKSSVKQIFQTQANNLFFGESDIRKNKLSNSLGRFAGV